MNEYIYLIHPFRHGFFDSPTPEEQAIMDAHFQYLKDALDQGRVILAGPCLDDTFGLVAAEALSCGLPVVAPLGSAQMEIHSGAGMAGYKAGDEANAISDCLRKAGKASAAAIRDVRKRYGKAGVAAMHSGVYEQIIENAERKSRTEAIA